MRLTYQPSLPPAEGSRIREWEPSREPDVMYADGFANPINKAEQDLGRKRGSREEMAPKKREGSSAA